nr:MAG TPA: hypothetical protein [Caudoviricetes sp.]
MSGRDFFNSFEPAKGIFARSPSPRLSIERYFKRE